MLLLLLFVLLISLDCSFDGGGGTFSVCLLNSFQLLLEFLSLLHTFCLFLGLFFLLTDPLTLGKAVESLPLLEFKVESSTEFVPVIDPQCVLELLHVFLLG